MTDRKPCPFCGYKNVVGRYEIIKGNDWFCLECPNCGAIVTFDDEAAETIHDVERLYNWRV